MVEGNVDNFYSKCGSFILKEDRVIIWEEFEYVSYYLEERYLIRIVNIVVWERNIFIVLGYLNFVICFLLKL